MDKLYTRIDEKLKLGSEFTDITIFPIMREIQDKMVKQNETYIINACVELGIDPNVLKNQLEEIHRLNAVINRLEKALDKACLYLHLSIQDTTYSRYEGNQLIERKEPHMSKEEWKEWLLKEVQEDE